MPEPTPEPRAEYVPPTLERHPDFTVVTGCSLPGGLGCLPLDSIPDLQDALDGG